MLKPKQLFIIIYVNVCVKRVYHKANNNIFRGLKLSIGNTRNWYITNNIEFTV